MIVYKYRPIDKYTEDLLKNNELHFSFPKDLNDPNDSLIFLKIDGKSDLYELIDKYSNNPAGEKKVYDLLFENGLNPILDESKIQILLSKLRNNILVYCLSEDNSDTTMWSHYSDSHKGIVFGFETMQDSMGFHWLEFEEIVDKTAPFLEQKLRPLLKVNYCDNRNSLIDDRDNFLKPFYTKTSEWSSEREYRMLIRFDEMGKQNIKFQKKILKEIIFGISTSEEDKKNIRKIVQDNYISLGYDVKFFQRSRKKNEYGIDIIPA